MDGVIDLETRWDTVWEHYPYSIERRVVRYFFSNGSDEDEVSTTPDGVTIYERVFQGYEACRPEDVPPMVRRAYEGFVR